MIYQKLLETILLPLGDFVNQASYIQELKYWRSVDKFSAEELKKLQLKNLRKVLQTAVSNIPFYNNIILKGDDPYQWLRSFPVLTKDLLRNKRCELIDLSLTGLIEYASSGSSGIQSSVFMSKKEQSIIRGILTHWWEWSGYRIGDPIVQTGMTINRSKLKATKDYFFRTYYLNAFSLTENQLELVCEKLQKSNEIYYLAGYASSLNIIAEFAFEKGYKINLASVISLGDKLFSNYRKNIEKAFSCKVYDTYGSNEGLMIAAQKDLDYLYILSPHVYIEIVDDQGQAVKDGTMGNILITRLDGFSMPLIRYKLGDLGIMLPKDKYPKNREFEYPLLQQIVGRETDVVILPSGKKLIVHSFTGVFEFYPQIKQFKVIQNKTSCIDIEYIEGNDFKLDLLKEITTELQKHIKDVSFVISYIKVQEIKPTKSGKPQIIESNIKK